MTMEEFIRKVCKTAIGGYAEPDSCSGCPWGSVGGVCQHPEHPKNAGKREEK